MLQYITTEENIKESEHLTTNHPIKLLTKTSDLTNSSAKHIRRNDTKKFFLQTTASSM